MVVFIKHTWQYWLVELSIRGALQSFCYRHFIQIRISAGTRFRFEFESNWSSKPAINPALFRLYQSRCVALKTSLSTLIWNIFQQSIFNWNQYISYQRFRQENQKCLTLNLKPLLSFNFEMSTQPAKDLRGRTPWSPHTAAAAHVWWGLAAQLAFVVPMIGSVFLFRSFAPPIPFHSESSLMKLLSNWQEDWSL